VVTDGGPIPEALILGGPNGAGKTTTAAELVPAGLRFLNSDVIAVRLVQEGHAPGGVEVAAGRVLLDQVRETVVAGESFCLETTLAGRTIGRWIAQWQEAGYRVRLVFVALDEPDLAVRRVAGRVADGGHDVPELVVRRRWAAGLRSLFNVCLPAVDAWLVIDNSDGEARPVAAGTRVQVAPQVIDPARWSRLIRVAGGLGAVSAWRYGR
jgi:predicted ABC-type ATPase